MGWQDTSAPDGPFDSLVQSLERLPQTVTDGMSAFTDTMCTFMDGIIELSRTLKRYRKQARAAGRIRAWGWPTATRGMGVLK